LALGFRIPLIVIIRARTAEIVWIIYSTVLIVIDPVTTLFSLRGILWILTSGIVLTLIIVIRRGAAFIVWVINKPIVIVINPVTTLRKSIAACKACNPGLLVLIGCGLRHKILPRKACELIVAGRVKVTLSIRVSITSLTVEAG
jgi:hypothetical protein